MRQVPLEQLANEWARVQPWIESALPYGSGDENALDILISLARGIYVLWVSDELAAVVQVVRWPRQTVLTILYTGGTSLDSMKTAFEFAKEWARANGVQVVRVYGRPAWEKTLHLRRTSAIVQVSV